MGDVHAPCHRVQEDGGWVGERLLLGHGTVCHQGNGIDDGVVGHGGVCGKGDPYPSHLYAENNPTFSQVFPSPLYAENNLKFSQILPGAMEAHAQQLSPC